MKLSHLSHTVIVFSILSFSLMLSSCNSTKKEEAQDRVRYSYSVEEGSGFDETHVETYSKIGGSYRLVQYDMYHVSYEFDEKTGLVKRATVTTEEEDGMVWSELTAVCDKNGHMVKGTVKVEAEEVAMVQCTYNDAGNIDYAEWTNIEPDAQYEWTDSFFWSEDGTELIGITRDSGTYDSIKSEKNKGTDIAFRCPVGMSPQLSAGEWVWITDVLFGAGLLGPWFEENVIVGYSQVEDTEGEVFYEATYSYEYGKDGIAGITMKPHLPGYQDTEATVTTSITWK